MKLSILIPMYNAQKYIGNCLDSLLCQDLPADDYEIIIMDDGSSDDSPNLVNAYIEKHKNIFLYREENAGAYSTRNKLLKLAKGDYIFNLDADDYIVHNCLHSLMEIAGNNNLDIVAFKTKDTTALDEFGLSESIDQKNIEVITGKDLIESDLSMRNEIWWYFTKRTFLENLGISFNKNEYNADVMFTLSVFLKAKRITFLNHRIHRYVQTEGSLMRSKNFDIVSKRVNYIQMMTLNKSKLINELKEGTNSNNETIVGNLSFRRDVFAFFNIINMVRGGFPKAHIKEKIDELKEVNAYPISHFLGEKYNSLTYRILVFLVNREMLLYPIITFHNLFLKIFRSTQK